MSGHSTGWLGMSPHLTVIHLGHYINVFPTGNCHKHTLHIMLICLPNAVLTRSITAIVSRLLATTSSTTVPQPSHQLVASVTNCFAVFHSTDRPWEPVNLKGLTQSLNWVKLMVTGDALVMVSLSRLPEDSRVRMVARLNLGLTPEAQSRRSHTRPLPNKSLSEEASTIPAILSPA